MSVSIKESTLSERHGTALKHTKSNIYLDCIGLIKNGEGDTNGQEKVTESESGMLNPRIISRELSIVFCDSKRVALRILRDSTNKLSISLNRRNVAVRKSSMCAKLSRKAQSYNYQEDSLSDSVKLKSSPFAQNTNVTRPVLIRHIRPPKNDAPMFKGTSKSKIVENNCVLNMSLNTAYCSFTRDVPRCQSYGALRQPKHIVIIDLSPEAQFFTGISNFEFDILAPHRGLYALEHSKSSYLMRRVYPPSESIDFFLPKFSPKVEALFYNDVDRQSNNSSTDTYTIRNDICIEEQNARTNIHYTFKEHSLCGSIQDSLKQRSLSKEGDQELIFAFSEHVITEEPEKAISARSSLASNTTLDLIRSKDDKIVDILSCYEFLTENDVEATRNLTKINYSVSQKIFAQPPPKFYLASDYGKFTSITTWQVMSSDNLRAKSNVPVRKRCSPVISETYKTGYLYDKYSRNWDHICVQDRRESKKTCKFVPTISNTTYIVE